MWAWRAPIPAIQKGYRFRSVTLCYYPFTSSGTVQGRCHPFPIGKLGTLPRFLLDFPVIQINTGSVPSYWTPWPCGAMSGRESAVKQAYRVNVYCILDYIKAGKCGMMGCFQAPVLLKRGKVRKVNPSVARRIWQLRQAWRINLTIFITPPHVIFNFSSYNHIVAP